MAFNQLVLKSGFFNCSYSVPEQGVETDQHQLTDEKGVAPKNPPTSPNMCTETAEPEAEPLVSLKSK